MAWDNSDNFSSSVFLVPSHWAVRNANVTGGWRERSALPVARRTKRKDSLLSQRARLSDMPTEILLQIFYYLIPTGQIFHFTPALKTSIQVVSVHRLMLANSQAPGVCDDIQAVLPRLSLVCRRLMDIAYTIFYGGNQFIFEIATQPLTSYVQCTSSCVGSWNKIIRSKPGCLPPLGSVSMRYLTKLTICISLIYRMPRDSEWDQLTRRVREIADAFEESSNELKGLVVNVDFAQRKATRFITDLLEVDTSQDLWMNVKTNRVVQAPRGASKIRARVASLVEPLKCLSGLQELEMTGMAAAEKAAKLEFTLTTSNKRRV